MFIPSYYRRDNFNELHEFIKSQPLGILISVTDNKPVLTHLAFTTKLEDGKLILISHLANFNPQQQLLTNGAEVTALFEGPHTYISPTLYGRRQSVPTWNYVSVEVKGKIKLLPSKQDMIHVLEEMINAYEPEYIPQWQELSEKYIDNLLIQLTAFQIEAETVEGYFKLSQDKPEADQENIIQYLSQQDDTNKKAVASYMQRLLEQNRQ